MRCKCEWHKVHYHLQSICPVIIWLRNGSTSHIHPVGHKTMWDCFKLQASKSGDSHPMKLGMRWHVANYWSYSLPVMIYDCIARENGHHGDLLSTFFIRLSHKKCFKESPTFYCSWRLSASECAVSLTNFLFSSSWISLQLLWFHSPTIVWDIRLTHCKNISSLTSTLFWLLI